MLESFDIGARLRARPVVRAPWTGAVHRYRQGCGQSKVQGSRPRPYSVTIKLKVLSNAEWQQPGGGACPSKRSLRQSCWLGRCRRISNRRSRTLGYRFSRRSRKIWTPSVRVRTGRIPCKHIAAVYYLLGEEFDRNPFLIFKLRGMEREELVALLNQGEPKAQRGKKKSQATTVTPQSEPVLPPEPLVVDIPGFWAKAVFLTTFSVRYRSHPRRRRLSNAWGTSRFGGAQSDSWTPSNQSTRMPRRADWMSSSARGRRSEWRAKSNHTRLAQFCRDETFTRMLPDLCVRGWQMLRPYATL